MRLLYIGINYWPDETGIAPFATGRCEYLASRGHSVTVCTAFPYYPQWRIPDEYRRKALVKEERNGVTILRSWLYVPAEPSTCRRTLHEASFLATSLVRAGLQKRPDLLVVTSPPLGLALTAIMLSRIWRIPYAFHVPDLQPDAALDLGMLRGGRVAQFLYKLEAMAYKHAALISTLNETMRDRIIEKGPDISKVRVFSDWIEPELFAIDFGGRADAAETDSHFTVAHFGNMGVKQGLNVVLQAAALNKNRSDIHHLLVGDGAAKVRLQHTARDLRLNNLTMLPLQPHARFIELLGGSHACLITQQRSVADIVFPSKTLTLLAAGRPVIASVGSGSEIAKVIRQSGGGLVVPPEEPASLAEAIRLLRDKPQLRRSMAVAGRQFAIRHWERDTVLSQMEQELSALADGTNARSFVSGRRLEKAA
jgi:colanic acid biosynthesis glycosyl transferase WcaI